MARLSILGLQSYDNTVLASLQLPYELEPQRQDITNAILLECGNLEFLYSSPETAKTAIGVWSRGNEYNWRTLYQTTVLQYDPIENYNRYEEIDRTNAGSEHTTDGHLNLINSTEHIDQTNKSDNTINYSGADTTTNKVAAYNSNDTQTASTDLMSYGSKDASTGTVRTYTGDNGNRTSTSNSDNRTIDAQTAGQERTVAHLHGNIGVTTSQEMIQSERELATLDLIQYIATEFKERFCILIY